MDIMDMFPSRVMPEPNSGCWIWTGAIGSGRNSYGHLKRDGRTIMMHRFSYELSHGPIPAGLFVLHKCDLKTCVNPCHLEVGSNQKNVQDAYSRGLHVVRIGEECTFSKMTEEQVAEIRAVKGRMRRGQQSEMAERFGVCCSAIRHVRTGRNWKRPSGRYKSGH